MNRREITPAFTLSGAKLCIDCETVFSSYGDCPRCTSAAWTYISKFLNQKEIVDYGRRIQKVSRDQG